MDKKSYLGDQIKKNFYHAVKAKLGALCMFGDKNLMEYIALWIIN